MVGKVERFRTDLNRLAFANRKGPRQGHIDLNGMRPLQAVVAEVAVCTRIRRSEGGCVDPVVGGLLARIYAAWIDDIGRLVLNRRQRAVRTRENCEQLGGRDGHNRGQLPVAGHHLERRI